MVREASTPGEQNIEQAEAPKSQLFQADPQIFATLVNKYKIRKNVQDITMLESSLKYEEIQNMIKTDFEKGIQGGQQDIEEREMHFGSNKPPVVPPKTFCKIFCDTLNDFILKILIGAAILSLVANMIIEEDHRDIAWIDGGAILIAVAIVSLVGSITDWRKEKQFQKMNAYANAKKIVQVIRDGQKVQINEAELLVGDIVYIEAGMQLPADGIVIQGKGVTTDQAAMTGESDQLKKESFQSCVTKLNQKMQSKGISDREGLDSHSVPSPILLSGTLIAQGQGLFLVIVVGERSAIGKIRESLRFSEQESTPLQQKLEAIARDIGKLGLITAVLTVVVLFLEFFIEQSVSDDGFVWDNDNLVKWLRFLIIGLTIIVVAIPQGLPLAVLISLAYSIVKMLKDKNFVKQLQSCEIMGSATCICSDKTGTLTKNQMNVTNFWQGRDIEFRSTAQSYNFGDYWQNDQLPDLLKQACICNTNAELTKGSATEIALLKLIDKFGVEIDPIRNRHVPPDGIRFQFTSQRKRMSTILQNVNNGEYGKRIHMKGAAEKVLWRCNSYIDAQGKIVEMDEAKKKDLENTVINAYAKRALRTICIAYKDVQPGEFGNSHDEEEKPGEYLIEKEGLICIGILGIKDVIRDEVPEAIRRCQRAGIRVRMVTGDNPITAVAIAKECGILTEEAPGCVIQGQDFEKQVGGLIRKTDPKNPKKILEEHLGDQAAFNKIINQLDIMARSRPEDKYLIVTGLKQCKDVVAVTGDGTNDAPALKKANVGFAMGIKGTDVAKEAADIIIQDDNFASIVKAVKWGRNIYDNIKRFLQFQLTVNVVALVTAFVAACVITDAVFSPVQLLWVNLIMDSLGSLALATAPPSETLLEDPPIKADDYIITRTMAKHIGGQSVYQCMVTFVLIFAGQYFLPEDSDRMPPNSNDNTLVHPGDFDNYPKQFRNEYGHSRHFTIVFNTFVWMQLFNQINCRMIKDEKNVFKDICKNSIFIIVWFSTAVIQVIIIQFGRLVFSVANDGLNWKQWLICLVFGFGTYLFRFILLLIPDKWCIELGKKKKDPLDGSEKSVLNIKRNHTISFKDKNQVIKGSKGASFGSMSQQAQHHQPSI